MNPLRSEPKIRRITIGRKQLLFLFPAGTEGAARGVIPLPQWSYPPIYNASAQLLFRILPQFFIFCQGWLKIKSSTYIEKIFPCNFCAKN